MTVSAQQHEQGLEQRRRAEESRAAAAQHRARAHELRAGGNVGDDDTDVDSDAFLHAGIEEVLAEIAELRAAGFDERAESADSLAQAEAAAGDEEREELLRRASASVIRAAELEAQAIALRDELAADPALHEALAEAAMARARAREQRALAAAARAAIADGSPTGALDSLRAERHDAWAELHDCLARAHRLRGEGLNELAEASQREAERLRQLAQAADARVSEPEGGVAEDGAADAAA